jgi:putative MATE family efflux protein
MSFPISESSTLSEASFWRDVAHALRGKQHDYTREPLNRAILLLAVPMVLEMLMESLFAIVDVFWVSRLGSDAIAIVGLTESVMTLIYAIAVGISIAGTAIVARRIGEKALEGAAQAAAQIITLGLAVSCGLGLGFGYFATDILKLMGASPSVVEAGANFTRLMLVGNVTVFMIFLINSIFRGAGDAVLAMRTLWLANGLNMVLAPFFIFGWGPFPELGVTGAAVATTMSRGVGVIYQLWHLMGHHSRIRLHLRHWQPAPDLLKRILITSSNGTAQLLIGTTSWIGLFRILALFGSAAIAGYTIAVRIMIVALLPAWGLASAASTLVGQNLGASQPDRAEAAVRIATRCNAVLLAAVGTSLAIFCDPIVRVFTTDPHVHAYAARALWIMSLAFPLNAIAMCMGAAFNGAGDTWTPTRVSFFCLWLGEIPLAWVLANVFGLGPVGVFIAVPVAGSVWALWGYVLFRRGQWKLLNI